MQTIRTISNISYNTTSFFRHTINRLVDMGVIDWAYWIYHMPDVDEEKGHIHFVLKPSKRLDTTELRKCFMELDPTNPLPLCCTTVWRFTPPEHMDDWLLYVVHDIGYLASKGQKRNIHYGFDDLRATDMDALRNDWNAIDRTKYDRLQYVYKAAEMSAPFALLVQLGLVPIAQRAQYEMQYNALVDLAKDPSCRRILNHEVDMFTGEVIDDNAIAMQETPHDLDGDFTL